MSPSPRSAFVPSGILIHPAVWPQRTLAKNWGLCPFGVGGSPSNTVWPGPRPTSILSRPRPRRLCVGWGPLSPSPKRGQSPFQIFDPFLLWPNGWMHQDATWYGSRPHPRRLCVRWGPSPPPKFSAHVYYSYCDFVRTLHSRYWFVQVHVLVLYAFYF